MDDLFRVLAVLAILIWGYIAFQSFERWMSRPTTIDSSRLGVEEPPELGQIPRHMSEDRMPRPFSTDLTPESLATLLYQRAEVMSKLNQDLPPALKGVIRDWERATLELFCLNCFVYEFQVRQVFSAATAQKILDEFYLIVLDRTVDPLVARAVFAERHEQYALVVRSDPHGRGISLGNALGRRMLELGGEEPNMAAWLLISERVSGDLVELRKMLSDISIRA